MLNVPKLDDLSYDKLSGRARSRIPMYTGDWTDFNDHDPGITTLQTLAWLTDTLNYYIDATGEEHRLKYLRLLGITPERAAARCLIALCAKEEKLAVAKGAKLAAKTTVFEIEESYTGGANRVTALFLEIDGKFTNLTPFAGVDGEYAALFTYDKAQEAAVYIGFERQLGTDIRFYVDVMPHFVRNPFEDHFTLSELEWESFDGEGWREARLLEDDTCGFLRSGFISLAADGGTSPAEAHPALPKAHYLRVKLLRNEYDALPRIGKIHPNCVRAVQTDTCAQALEMVADGGTELVIDYHIGEHDVICVAVEDGDGYSLWFEHTLDEASLCEVAVGEYPWQRCIRFDDKRFGVLPERDRKILVTVTDTRIYDKLRPGMTSGFARERLEMDLENLYELRLAIAEEKNGRMHYSLWNECDNISRAAPDERVFELDRKTGFIIFGDGINGLQPGAGRWVLAVTAKTSLLDLGNVRGNRVDHFLDEVYQDIQVHNPEDAAGGKRPKPAMELEREIEDKIYKVTRAVTAQDYVDVVSATPGLMIDGVNVIGSSDYARFYGGEHRPNTVLVSVKPYSGHEPRPMLGEAYRRRIRENIERYRLLTTDVRILSARYAGVEVDGRIVLTENTSALRQQVEEKLCEFINPTNGKGFGAGLIYGRIFSHLEMLDCVVKVSELLFTCIGEGAHKNEQGDIIVYPDTIAYLSKINIEFV